MNNKNSESVEIGKIWWSKNCNIFRKHAVFMKSIQSGKLKVRGNFGNLFKVSLLDFFVISGLFAILPDNVESYGFIKNLFKIKIIFGNAFKRSFYTWLKISRLFANLPENLETDRSMKNMTEFFEKKTFLKNPVSLKSLYRHSTMHLQTAMSQCDHRFVSSLSESSFVKISSQHVHTQIARARGLKVWEKVDLPPPLILKAWIKEGIKRGLRGPWRSSCGPRGLFFS